MNILGLDPGSDGAMTVLSPDRRARVFRFKDKTEQEIAHAIIAESLEPCRAFLEKVHSMPGQGVSTMFTFGRNLGFLRGVLVGAGIQFEDVPPQKWQQGVGMGKSYPTQQQRKKAATQLAQQLYPGVHITQASGDSVLIAEYGYRVNIGRAR